MTNNPPAELDGGKVLYWAWSGDKPFGFITYSDGTIAAEIYGFAICLCQGNILRFSCDREWKVQNDAHYTSPEEAMNNISMWHKNIPIYWNKYDDTNIELLLFESEKIAFYQELGERRMIQKIVAHLTQHGCKGFSTRLISEDTWLLSVLRKDLTVASQIAKQNIDSTLFPSSW